MTKDRLWIFGGIALVLVIAIGGYFLGISPLLSQATTVAAQTGTITATNAKTQADLASLKTQFAGIGTLKTKLDTLRGSIPETADASTLLNELAAIAAANSATISSVTVGSATLYNASSGDSTTSAPAATPTSTASPAAPATSPTTPTVTVGGGLTIVPISVAATGSFAAVNAFEGAVQTGTRLFFITNAQIGGDSGTTESTGTITGYAYTLQGTSDVVSTTPLVPTPDATVTPTATPTPTPTATATTSGKTTGTTTTTNGTSTKTVPVPTSSASSTDPVPVPSSTDGS